MNRRQLLKGLGVLPIAGAMGCAEESPRPVPGRQCHTLQITLEGAFAVVLRRQQGQYRVTAFSPASPTAPPKDVDCPKDLFPIEPHEFSFNGKQQPAGNYHFELSPQGLDATPRPIIDIGFRDFTAETERWRLANNFVTIDLPTPKTISFYGQPDVVVFAFPAGAHRTGQMPSNHILEYQVNDPSQIKMVCRGLKDPCVPSSKSTPDVTRYSFSVGLLPQRDRDGRHAVKFFNYLLCAFFPDLVKAYSLSHAGYGTANPAGTRGAELEEPNERMVPAVWKNTSSVPRLLMVSEAVDCIAGGIIVTTDRGPTS
ncbi:MAG TPA: hypothetical protein VG649_06845 [Candidatus Angelobacter sp.]|jgi:hypothetical protein|nr:hypothetical protein [Candidatus Angelobacter sp.]